MILISGKVVENVGAQWKEVRDNRVQGKDKQTKEHVKTRKKIVPVDKVAQQVQTMNKFVVLDVEQSDINENNQLVMVEERSVQKIGVTTKSPGIEK